MKNRRSIIIFLLSFAFVLNLHASGAGPIYGIDISHHQGTIDWDKVREWQGNKIHFVYIKATEGATLIDNRYMNNLAGAKDHSLLVGSYHYFKTSSSAKAQFENFKKVADKTKQNLIPIVDVEERGRCNMKMFHSNLKCFLDLMERHYGCKPMIYTANTFYNRYLANKYKEYKIFIGRYSKNTPIMKDNQNWCIWQFSKRGNIDGIPRDVDINIMQERFDLSDILMNNN